MNVNSFLKQIREGYSPSKAEEIELLDALHLAFVGNSNTHLHSLFSADFAYWVDAQITLDVSTDMMGAWTRLQATRDTNLEEARAVGAELSEALESAQKRIENHKMVLADVKDSNDKLHEQLREKEKAIHELRTEIAAHRYLVSKLSYFAGSRWLDGKTISPEELRDMITGAENI